MFKSFLILVAFVCIFPINLYLMDQKNLVNDIKIIKCKKCFPCPRNRSYTLGMVGIFPDKPISPWCISIAEHLSRSHYSDNKCRLCNQEVEEQFSKEHMDLHFSKFLTGEELNYLQVQRSTQSLHKQIEKLIDNTNKSKAEQFVKDVLNL